MSQSVGGMCVFPFLDDPPEHYDCLIALVLHDLIGVLLTPFFGWPAPLLTLIVPVFISGAVGLYLFYAQHNSPGVTFNDAAGWTYQKAGDAIVQLYGNRSDYGLVHSEYRLSPYPHLNARIPFYRLPEVLREIPELQTTKKTSLNPIKIFRCLRLKVWDAESQRMISGSASQGLTSGLRYLAKTSRPRIRVEIGGTDSGDLLKAF
jgi:omega-6 fatty acid desaturase (delta-12 desaturase)